MVSDVINDMTTDIFENMTQDALESVQKALVDNVSELTQELASSLAEAGDSYLNMLGGDVAYIFAEDFVANTMFDAVSLFASSGADEVAWETEDIIENTLIEVHNTSKFNFVESVNFLAEEGYISNDQETMLLNSLIESNDLVVETTGEGSEEEESVIEFLLEELGDAVKEGTEEFGKEWAEHVIEKEIEDSSEDDQEE